MAADAQAAADFYGTLWGTVAGALVRERLALLWPDLTGMDVLGFGFAPPYLRAWRHQAARCIAATPAQVGATRWPVEEPNLGCLVDEDALPFPDLSFDRILLVHGLETAQSAPRALREVWRVLRDDGRLLVVLPNRLGIWAHAEATPFGHGQPFSQGQIARLLADCLFRVERRDSALYLPPLSWRIVLRGAGVWERVGRRITPRFAGVTITEGVKDLYGAVPSAGREARHRVVFPETAYSVSRPGWDAKRCSSLSDEHLHAERLSQASRDLL